MSTQNVTSAKVLANYSGKSLKIFGVAMLALYLALGGGLLIAAIQENQPIWAGVTIVLTLGAVVFLYRFAFRTSLIVTDNELIVTNSGKRTIVPWSEVKEVSSPPSGEYVHIRKLDGTDVTAQVVWGFWPRFFRKENHMEHEAHRINDLRPLPRTAKSPAP